LSDDQRGPDEVWDGEEEQTSEGETEHRVLTVSGGLEDQDQEPGEQQHRQGEGLTSFRRASRPSVPEVRELHRGDEAALHVAFHSQELRHDHVGRDLSDGYECRHDQQGQAHRAGDGPHGDEDAE
jgi:hypothetical protein